MSKLEIGRSVLLNLNFFVFNLYIITICSVIIMFKGWCLQTQLGYKNLTGFSTWVANPRTRNRQRGLQTRSNFWEIHYVWIFQSQPLNLVEAPKFSTIYSLNFIYLSLLYKYFCPFYLSFCKINKAFVNISNFIKWENGTSI